MKLRLGDALLNRKFAPASIRHQRQAEPRSSASLATEEKNSTEAVRSLLMKGKEWGRVPVRNFMGLDARSRARVSRAMLGAKQQEQ